MTALAKAYELYRSAGIGPTARHSLRYTLQSPLYPILSRVLPESLYEKVVAYPVLGYWPDIRDPETFNEKLIYRKLFTDNSLYTTVSDKVRVREYVRKKVGEEILTDVYQVTTDPSSLEFESFPDQFVIKPNHASGEVILVDETTQVEPATVQSQCETWLETTYKVTEREYWYRDIEPQILVEEYIKQSDREVPLDFKFWVFNGEVEYIDVDFDRFDDHQIRFFDRSWEPMDFQIGYPLGPAIEPPPDLERMIQIAEKLAEDFDFARIDLYNPSQGEILFGEITLTPSAGWARFDPIEFDYHFGDLWDMG
ncbi:ATP-grasp fold amidoligase family protein [Halorubrum ezzemoulense]|uniref:ATP-grasp fold amidoligase family protein n=1 Tax=Halorubrum ezzemoulense TaxID=337243 RepID=UPI00232C88E9|nr:ATP-grasp fold amidoligase family protein [Halorubrum ezzemoulense]MDB9281520.1 ATP-grasp fold amidoligase family protein [Halorubrum ezzemoulense]MDB9285050.1 ATP-grasp fold amidoligase family protein [Halorubrum ezzemoulense]